MKQNDIGDRRTLRQLIAEMVPLTQSYVFDSGYKIPSDLAKTLAISAVVASGRASEREIQNAISGV